MKKKLFRIATDNGSNQLNKFKKMRTQTVNNETQFHNQDLKRDIEKHKNADQVEITSESSKDENGMPIFYLDVNCDTYIYFDEVEMATDERLLTEIFN